ncbi:alpha/beta hydrolase [Paenibacillus sp. 19GGS1-52]|uniref:alpha/beta fold hydrolase n=1 Tax=Paenibacillus sp. 19GGS1-52 TaxID=2758563 RepID=UPI001EFAE949|nr:alpha/beta hydrolase [Paenibacillus sp. 19GGS1-52]ULO06445.1 alpha/beta hydrolase [Paenibacillus sp. 19GGS1-52]
MLYSDNNITFNYEVRGEGRPMLILHGNGPDHRMMMGCMEPVFSEQDFIRRIYVDLPGMGKSPAANWITSSDDMLKAVGMMIEALIPQERFAVVGESYGGYLARGLVRNYHSRIEGLLLLCPCIIAESDKRELPPHQVMYSDEQLLDELSEIEREEFCSISVVQNRQAWSRFNQEIMCGLPLADEAFMQQIRVTGGYPFSFEVDDILPLDKPTLILVGRQDSLVGFKDAWKLMDNYPHATFAVLDRSGHNLQLEQAELFNGLTREWLSRMT